MRPSTVLVILGVLLCATSTQYYFLVPKSIQVHINSSDNNAGSNSDNQGYWGTPTAEFNWCEYNYQWTSFIAEPWNTITSLVYSIGTYAVYRDLQPFAKYTSLTDMHITLFIVFLLGIGSALFHATLLYKLQLLDELSMYILVSYVSVVLYSRKITDVESLKTNANRKSKKWYLHCFSFFVFCVICIILWFTNRQSLIHNITRGWIVITFSIYFLYIFIVGAMAANQVSNYAKERHSICDTYFDRAFIFFVVAILCWLMDNWYCDILHNLKIPYVSLHAFGWHIFTGLGMYYFGLVLICHQLIIDEGMTECISYNNRRIFGVFPNVIIEERKMQIKKGKKKKKGRKQY